MTFTVAPGQVTGFVGPNGAGKSTTMRVILGLDAPDAGTALVGGRPYASLRRPLTRVGSLLDAGALQPSRTGRNHLLWLAHSQGLPARRVDEVIGQAGLDSAARRRAGGYSLGMRQRLGIAAALLGDPPALMLDEPFNGMDPEGIVWMRGFLRSLAARGPGGAGVQPPDERAAGHRGPPGDRRPRAGDRRHQRPDLLAAASGGRVTLRTAAPAQAMEVLAQAGAAVAAEGPGVVTISGHTGRTSGRAAHPPRCAVLRGGRPPRDPGAGLPGAHQGRGRVPRRLAGRDGGGPMTATATPERTSARRYGFARLLHAEWTKFRTVRGWIVAMVIAALLIVLIGLYAAIRRPGHLR